MAMTTQLHQTWKPEIDAYIQDELDQMPDSLYKQVFTVRTSDRLQLQEVDYGAFTPMVTVGELGDAVEDNAIEGYKNLYQGLNYRKSATFSSDLLETDQTGEVERIARSFANVVEYSRNLWVFSSWRRGWDGLITYGDSKPLFSIAHPLKTGGYTNANTFADGVQRPLSYDNVLLAQDAMIANVSQSGNILQNGAIGRNKVLWCSPYLREKAFQLAGVHDLPSEKPTTTDRAKNYFVSGDKFDVLVVPWVSYEAARQAGETGTVTKSSNSNYWDSMWGLMDTDLFKRFAKVWFRTGYPMFADEITKANQAFVKYAYDKYAYGYTSPLGIFGSKGDSSTVTL